MGDRLDHLNHLSKMHRDALRGGGRVIQFMCKAGGHCSERLQLLLLLRRTFQVAKTRRHRAENLAGNRRTEPQQTPKPLFRENDESGVGFRARGQNVGDAQQQRDLAKKCAGPVARDNNLLVAVLFGDADFTLKEHKKMLRVLPLLDEHFARGKPPFFRLLDANLIFILKVRKEGNLAEQVHHRLGVRHLCDGSQNRSRY